MSSTDDRFKLVTDFELRGDQPQAVRELTDGLRRGDACQVLLGVTGSGKTFTLAQVIAGNEDYEITGGSIRYEGEDLLEMSADKRACEGIFLGFQYPVEIPGVNNNYFGTLWGRRPHKRRQIIILGLCGAEGPQI